VGSGGVMLPNHAPLVVAEQFGTLEALYPGRIDLGLGRAPGGDYATMRALRRDMAQTGDDFPELLAELRAYLGPEKPGQAVRAFPGQGSHVPMTLLGSSLFSAQLAARLGLPFAFAAHFAPEHLVCGFAVVPGGFPAERDAGGALPDDCRAGDCGGDGCWRLGGCSLRCSSGFCA
jgi:luciferase family oxidoreductase group 1